MTLRAGLLGAILLAAAVIGAAALLRAGDETEITGTAGARGLAATRLVGGPALFRLSGVPADVQGSLAIIRDVVVFKLNQDPYSESTPYAFDGVGVQRAVVMIGQPPNQATEAAYRLGGAARPAASPHCFLAGIALLYSGKPTPGGLDRVSPGDRVAVTLRALTWPRPSSTRPSLTPPLRRSATLHSADYLLRSPDARKRLERIGCREAAAERGAVMRALCAHTIAAEGRGHCHWRPRRR